MRSTIAVSVRRATNREVMRSTSGKGNRLEILACQLDGVNSACGKPLKYSLLILFLLQIVSIVDKIYNDDCSHNSYRCHVTCIYTFNTQVLPIHYMLSTMYRLSSKAECLNMFEKWHMAYHGAHVSSIRRTLDTGHLMPQGLPARSY